MIQIFLRASRGRTVRKTDLSPLHPGANARCDGERVSSRDDYKRYLRRFSGIGPLLIAVAICACNSVGSAHRVEATSNVASESPTSPGSPFMQSNAYPASQDMPIWSVNLPKSQLPRLSREQWRRLSEIKARLQPKYRRYLKVALLGPRATFSVFVSRGAVPPDYGAESIDLADCRSTPGCKYSCGGRFVDGGTSLISPSSKFVCEDGALFFFSDVDSPFPRGQKH